MAGIVNCAKMLKIIILLFFIVNKATATESYLDVDAICSSVLYYPIAHPTDRTLFIACIKGRGMIIGCDREGDVFDPNTISCVLASSIDNICENISNGILPHEEKCEYYIVCEQFTPLVRRCPENNIYDPSVQGCVSGNSQTCELAEKDLTTITEQTTIKLTTEIPVTTEIERTTEAQDPPKVGISFVCPSSGNGLVAHATNCSRYFECLNGIRNLRNCPSGLIFDVITRRCGAIGSSFCSVNIQCI